MRLIERLPTIAATATLTSAAWILFGSLWLSRTAPPSEPSPVALASVPAASGAGSIGRPTPPGTVRANAAGLIIPVAGVTADQLSDTFDDARGGGRPHQALDVMAPRGTLVIAAAAGTIEKLFHSDNGGNTIYVRSPDRATIYYYAHLDRYADGLHEGQAVKQGQALGLVGSTGDASADAPHLHFEIMQTTPDAKWYQPKTSINPYPLLTGE
jgi:murein DD-endopeptidase MepM/ murein hydrolase activator NlpD